MGSWNVPWKTLSAFDGADKVGLSSEVLAVGRWLLFPQQNTCFWVCCQRLGNGVYLQCLIKDIYSICVCVCIRSYAQCIHLVSPTYLPITVRLWNQRAERQLFISQPSDGWWHFSQTHAPRCDHSTVCNSCSALLEGDANLDTKCIIPDKILLVLYFLLKVFPSIRTVDK